MKNENSAFGMTELDRWHDGNVFFQYEHATLDIISQIKKLNTFQDFDNFLTDELIDGNNLLSEYLTELLERHNAKPDFVSVKIGYSHDYVRKIAVGDRKEPSRDVLLAICTFIHATVEETQLLLRYAGHRSLYARRRRDAIIWYALMKRKDFEKLNNYLEAKQMKTLWKA